MADAIMRGANERLIREHNELAWLAWHIAALQRTKKLPSLKKLQIASKQQRPQQTWQQQLAVARMWTAALGGKVISVGPAA